MAKKPKKKWQIEVRGKLDAMGIGYNELAERIGENSGSVRQAMCKDSLPVLSKKICDYFGIEYSSED